MTWITRRRRGAAAAQMKHLNSFGNLGKIVKAVAAVGCGLDAMAGSWRWARYLSLNCLLQRREVPNCFRSDGGSGSVLLARDEAPRPTSQVRTNQIGRPKAERPKIRSFPRQHFRLCQLQFWLHQRIHSDKFDRFPWLASPVSIDSFSHKCLLYRPIGLASASHLEPVSKFKADAAATPPPH